MQNLIKGCRLCFYACQGDSCLAAVVYDEQEPHRVECKRCGTYFIDRETLASITDKEQKRVGYIWSSAARQHHERGDALTFTKDLLREIPLQTREPSMLEKVDRLLLIMAAECEADSRIGVTDNNYYYAPMILARDWDDMNDARNKLKSEGYIEIDRKRIITVPGWKRVEELRRVSQLSGPAGQRERVKILFLSADPTDQTRLRIGQEYRDIGAGLVRARHRDMFDLLKPGFSMTARDLHRAVAESQPTIVHFSGHGEETRGILVENEMGTHNLVTGPALAALFRSCKGKVKCVLLNACFSEHQADSIRQQVDYVIGMKDGIGDRAAIIFAVAFYDSLGRGETYEEAFDHGTIALQLAGIPEDHIPVLKKRAGVQLP